MDLKTWLSQGKGRASALARALDLPQSFVSNMAAGHKAVPVVHMARIELFTGGAVTRAEMRPCDWRAIWPELDSTNNQIKQAA